MTDFTDPNKMDYFRRSNFLTDPDPKIVEVISTGLTYTGFSVPGVLTSEPYWLVKKSVTVAGTTTHSYSSIYKKWDSIWDSRTGLTYY